MSRTTRQVGYSLPPKLIEWVEKRARKYGNGSRSAFVASIIKEAMEKENAPS